MKRLALFMAGPALLLLVGHLAVKGPDALLAPQVVTTAGAEVHSALCKR